MRERREGENHARLAGGGVTRSQHYIYITTHTHTNANTKRAQTFHCQGVVATDAKQLVSVFSYHFMAQKVNQHSFKPSSPLPHVNTPINTLLLANGPYLFHMATHTNTHTKNLSYSESMACAVFQSSPRPSLPRHYEP